MVNPGMAVNLAMSGFGFYGMLGFAAPQLCYKLLFRGGLWPGAKRNKDLPDEGDIVHCQTARWMGFCVLYDLFNTHRLTNGFKDNRKILLENQSALWAGAALMHIPAMNTGAHPKAICLQNMVSFPLVSLIAFLASKKC